MNANLDIRLTEEQTMLRDAARHYMDKEYAFTTRAGILAAQAAGTPVDEGKWRDYANMGWLGLTLPEAAGGMGAGLFEAFLLAEAFGRALAVEPVMESVILAGMTLAAAGTPEQQALLPELAAGKLRLAMACAEPQGGYDWNDVATRARPASDGYLLEGRKSVVLGAPGAHHLLVSARTAGGQRERAGISLFLVAANAPGVRLRGYPTIDGRQAAEVELAGVRVGADALVGPLHGAVALLDAAQARGTIWLLGEAVGCLEGTVATTVEYLNNREQFGQKLSKFQALRHRVADMYIAKEESRALCLLAAHAHGTPEGPAAAAAAKAWIGQTGRHVGDEGVQLHGAIAITDEYIVGHYLKRLIAIDRMFGDGSAALDRYLALGGGLGGSGSSGSTSGSGGFDDPPAQAA